MTINLDEELEHFLSDSKVNLTTMKASLRAIEMGSHDSPTEQNQERVNSLFRSIHSIKTGASYFDLLEVQQLAHRAEHVLGLCQSRKTIPTSAEIEVLLSTGNTLREMLDNRGRGHDVDLYPVHGQLNLLASAASGVDPALAGRHLRVLIVEDDFTSRLLLQTFLSRHGDCHIAVNGKEAVKAFGNALAAGAPYDLICMDIMLPEIDGIEAVRQVRSIEEAHGIVSSNGAKIMMTTSMRGIKEITRSFNALCDFYLFKPIDTGRLLGHMRSLRLIA